MRVGRRLQLNGFLKVAPCTVWVTNAAEQGVCSALMLVSAFVYAQVIGNFTSVVANLNPEQAHFRATLHDLNGIVRAAEQRELSDSLGVSSALYLGASDMLKLCAMRMRRSMLRGWFMTRFTASFLSMYLALQSCIL